MCYTVEINLNRLFFCSYEKRREVFKQHFFPIFSKYILYFNVFLSNKNYFCLYAVFLSIMDGIKNYPPSPPPFSKPFFVSNCFVNRLKNNFEQLDSCLIHSWFFCCLLANTSMDVAYFVDFAWIENNPTNIAFLYKFLLPIYSSLILLYTEYTIDIRLQQCIRVLQYSLFFFFAILAE